MQLRPGALSLIDGALQLHHEFAVVPGAELAARAGLCAAPARAERDQRLGGEGAGLHASTVPRGGHDPRGQNDAALVGHARGERIAQLEGDDAAAFLADLGLTESGLNRVIRTTYDLLGYMSFFTVGEDECRAWSIARGTPAQLAAGEIHSDIQRGFIRAEVVAYDALITRGAMAACRDHGEVRLEGKEYVVQDGDIINFRFAT